ncbi:hypothetical protein TgHK011_004401 [Trichoderma gracile]|nr:hypothetical protein TgHK011_004401 [Trichoderma gracile]
MHAQLHEGRGTVLYCLEDPDPHADKARRDERHGGASEVPGQWPTGFPRCMAYDSRPRRDPRTYSAPSSPIRLVHVSMRRSYGAQAEQGRDPSQGDKREQEHGEPWGSAVPGAQPWRSVLKRVIVEGFPVASKQYGIHWRPRRVDRAGCRLPVALEGPVSGQLSSVSSECGALEALQEDYYFVLVVLLRGKCGHAAMYEWYLEIPICVFPPVCEACGVPTDTDAPAPHDAGRPRFPFSFRLVAPLIQVPVQPSGWSAWRKVDGTIPRRRLMLASGHLCNDLDLSSIALPFGECRISTRFHRVYTHQPPNENYRPRSRSRLLDEGGRPVWTRMHETRLLAFGSS